jgi:hypothetical protein
MLSVPITADEWIEQRLTLDDLLVYQRAPYAHHKDILSRLEPIFRILQSPPRVTGFMDALARKTSISRSMLSKHKANLVANLPWRPMRINYSCGERPFRDEREHELVTPITVRDIDKGFLYSDANRSINQSFMLLIPICPSL